MKLKRILTAIMLLGIFVNCCADCGKQDKSFQKESKKVYKELKKEGWKLYGNTLPLDMAIDQYYQKLGECHGTLLPLKGEAIADNENLALRKARQRAVSQLAAQQDTHVSSETNIQISNEISDEAKSQMTFENTVWSSVDQSIKSMRPELTLIRHMDNGQVEVKMLFLIKQ